MRRYPFYAHPSFPHSFYTSPADASFHRPHPASSSPVPPTPAPRSVINVPVFDCAPQQSSSSPAQRPFAAGTHLDPSAAATVIQSHFRGFCIRKHHPLLHLRSIAKFRKQLEELQSELEKPGFSVKVRESEKERLRFNESVMAIILRLDAIEGSIAEVRSQRKEATKMAVKLQDAMDAIIMQREGDLALDRTAGESDMASIQGSMAPSEDSVPPEQTQKHLRTEFDIIQGDVVPENCIMDAAPSKESHLSIEDGDADKPLLGHAECNVTEAENGSSLTPCEVDLDLEGEAGFARGELCTECTLTSNRHGFEESSSEAHEANVGDEEKADVESASMVKRPSAPQENAVLQQLSEECQQLKSLVGKLLRQNKAQSNVLCALAKRLEMLERREQGKCRHDQEEVRERRKKPKKGCKRNVRCPEWESFL